MNEVVSHLKTMGYPVSNAIFTYFSTANRIFTYCGKDPYTEPFSIPLADCQERLILKCRETSNKTNTSDQSETNSGTRKKSGTKRNKERKITEIIEKVSQWRQLYTGIPKQDGQIEKYTLEEASLKVGIAKKTLDDYLLQLRAGKKYGFDFNSHKESKVGVLRAFVKKAKADENGVKGNKKTENGNQGNQSKYKLLDDNEG
jgi:hypothetical protein